MTGVLVRRECHMNTDAQVAGQMPGEAETRVTQVWKPRNMEEWWQPPEAGKRPGRILPESQRARGLADTLTLDF